MAKHKLNWVFDNKKDALKAVNLFGANSLHNIKFYKSEIGKKEKLFENKCYQHLWRVHADIKAKKDLKDFFDKNKSYSCYVNFVKK